MARGSAKSIGRTVGALMLVQMVCAPLVNFGWLPRNGINGWTGKPKARYYQLRGWKLPPE